MHHPVEPSPGEEPAPPATPADTAQAPSASAPAIEMAAAVGAASLADGARSPAPAVSAEASALANQSAAADAAATTSEAAVAPALPAEMPPQAPVKVLAIDDELAGLTAAHLRESAQAFVDELADINSPTTAVVWSVVSMLTQRPPLADVEPADVEAYFASDDFVRHVVLSAELRAVDLPHPEMLHGFYGHESVVRELRAMLEAAYAAPEFELTFLAARPAAPDALRDYDLVVLDLVLADSAAAVDDLVTYLAALARNDAKLPCLIILSSREEMVDNRPRFSTDSNISAAGLLMLEKKHVRQPQFGVTGLLLSYGRLTRQRDVAHNIRMFIREWMTALDDAKKAAGETLWNLDAAAMQEIHLSASSDDDPYDAHLNELVSREYLWHVEGAASVAKAVDALDTAFQVHLKNENEKLTIMERFVAPYADAKPGRTVVSHYNWTGFKPTGRLDQYSAAELAAKFNRFVPFGAVLAPHVMAVGTDCWVHITQQCDLNGAVRVKKGATAPDCKNSAMFAVATAVAVSDGSVPDHSTQDLVARGLRVGNQEYDLKLVNGCLVSLPINELIGMLREKRQVVGRLRHDIATQFLNATANHMTRPAQLKATRVEVRPARLTLWGKGFNGDQPLPFAAADGTPRTLQVSTSNKLYYFADDASMWVALWLAEQVRAQLGKTVVPTKVYNTVRGGMRKNGNVVSVINLNVEMRAFDQIEALWQGTLPDKATLYLIYEPDPPAATPP